MDLTRRAYFIALITLAGLFTATLSLRPYYNWDIFPYIAITLGPGDQHLRTFQDAAQHMPAHDFEALTARQPVLFADPLAFHAILPYYHTKPGYTLITRLLYMTGVSATAATYIPSLFFYFVLVLVIGSWLTNCLSYRNALFVTLGIALLPFLSMTARFSSPDMLCAACTVAGLYLLSFYRTVWGLVLFVVSITFRPDAVLLAVPLIYCVLPCGIITRRQGWIIAIVSITTTLWALGDLALIPEYLFTLKPWTPELTIPEFMTTYLFNLIHGLPSIINSSIPIFMLITIIGWIYQTQQTKPDKFWLNCLGAACFSIVIRYLLHPLIEDRFLIGAYVIILLATLHIIFANRSRIQITKQPESINLSKT
jgi:hypothetical protein